MVRISRVLIAVAAAGLLVSACTVKKTERPQLTGPSELALSLTLSASPDILTQDGSSQSHVVILARDQNGLAVKGLPLHVEITVAGSVTAFGQLSSQDVSTGSDGRATLSYTAPTAIDSVDRGTIVAIRVTPTGTDYGTSEPRSVNIRLVPPGFIPAGPVAAYTYSPTLPVPNSPVTFDASASLSNTAIIGYSWDFGDGTTGSGVSPQHTYRAAGSYRVTLTITDDKGRTSNPCEETIVVASATSPIANFGFSPSTPAPSQTIFFNASTSVAGTGRTIADCAWDFGNGRSAHGVTTTTSYDAAGTYNVTLIVTDDVGQKASKAQSVTVSQSSSAAPTAAFVFSPGSPAVGEPLFFDASTSAAATGHSITSYAWSFGDGTTGTGRTMTKAAGYAAAATYNVVLTVTDDLGHTGSASQAVTVGTGSVAAPTAAFVFSPSSPVVGQQVFFDASTSSATAGHSITSYAWSFGDGTTGTGRTMAKVAGYAAAATYNVVLTVTDDLGHTGSASQAVTVVGTGSVAAPTPAFTFSPSAPAVGEPVFFDASTSTAASGHSITSYAWAFGDGTTGTSRTFTKTAGYATAATYSVVLTVTDDLGHTGTTSQTVTVGNAITPTAKFSVSPSPAVVNSQVVVDASTSTTSVGQTIVRYEWNFGDSAAIELTTDRTFAHTYRTKGIYTITLTITDSANRRASSTTLLTVGDGSVVANFTFSPSPGAVGVAITFDASTSTGVNPLHYDWTFGDSFIASGPLAIVNHSYATTSTYIVTLMVTDTVTSQSSTISHAVIVQ
jgi:PKD repeat protein